MGTIENDKDRILRLKCLTEVPKLGFSSSPSLSNVDEAFIDMFQNVALESSSTMNELVKDSGGPEGSGTVLPLRPYAVDCPYYIRTGTCKFGSNCKFNHPMIRSTQVVKENLNDSESEDYEKIECKYYLTPGGCKYGKFCKYNHSKDESEIVPPELNSLGLPIRSGEKECPYYMRYGSCGFGARCVFHHPELTSIEGFDYLNSTLDDESILQSGYTFDDGSTSLLCPRTSWQDQTPWTSYLVSNYYPYQNDSPSYVTMSSFPQETHTWSEYQASESPRENSMQAYLAPGAGADAVELDIPMKVEEFPERPGEPICTFFLKTGDCKFKSTCRFHHPKDWARKSDKCALSDKGLPLRPGETICRHYELFGICKFGRACMFDHPINHTFPPSPIRSTSKPASNHDA